MKAKISNFAHKKNHGLVSNKLHSLALSNRAWASALWIAFLSVVMGCQERQQSHLEKVLAKGEIHIVTRNNPTTFYEGVDGPAGLEYDLARQFADYLNVELRVSIADSPQTISEQVANHQVDFAAAGLTITPARAKAFRHAPPYQDVSQKLVFKQGKTWPRDFNQLKGSLRVASQSSHAERLLTLKSEFPELSWSEANDTDSEDLMAQVLKEEIDYTIADSNELALNRRFYPELAIAFSVTEPLPLAWSFAKDRDDSLLVQAIEFFGHIKASGKLASLLDRYYGHVKKFDYVGTKHFLDASADKLGQYVGLFKEAGLSHNLDWRLLAALSYQESHWNPKAKSPTGVRGMMMLTLPTAKQMKVSNRLDAEQSIVGGARYLKKILSRVPNSIANPDRTWFALAAYNVGWGHVQDARKITELEGENPNKWVDVKKRLPLLRKKKYYKFTRYGYARGDEAVAYVTNIRRYYETLSYLHQEPTFHDLPDLPVAPEKLVADNDEKSKKTLEQSEAISAGNKALVTE